MNYRLNIEQIKTNFKFNLNSESKFKLKHQHGKAIKILPYITSKADDNSIIFKTISDDFSSAISGKNLKTGLNIDSLCECIIKKVEMNNELNENIKNIIKELFLNNEELQVFHPLIFNYRSAQYEIKDKKIAGLLYNILFDESLKEKVSKIYGEKPKNILLRLVLDSLPETNHNIKDLKENYVNYVPFVKNKFIEDFEYMLTNEKLYVEELENVLKYYYFFYVSQLSLKLNQMFKADVTTPEPLYFHLDGEKVSKSRTSYGKGWENLLSEKTEKLFSHAICLEMLNHSFSEVEKKFTYVDIANTLNSMNEEEVTNFNNDIENIIDLYIKHVQDIDWANFSINYYPYKDNCLNKIYELFCAIDYQFMQSVGNRLGKRKNYYEWFTKFCKKNFLKRHGPLGFTLNLTQDYLILITRLCIKDSEKIGVKKLFTEFEKRGLFFDRDSKEAIMKLFEKLNLLEKKSDSGDAQYVKAIL